MKSEEILNLKVVDIESGTTIGSVTGVLIDSESKRVTALQVGGGFLSHPDYLAFPSIKAIENDVIMVASESSVVRGEAFGNAKMIDKLIGRHVLTVDGKDIGTARDYRFDEHTGDITFVSVAIDTAVLGGLWQSTGECFDIPRSQIVALGDSIVVDRSVAEIQGEGKAA